MMSAPAPLDGAALAWPWAVPFVGLLLTIALAPTLMPRAWARHYGKITAGWSLLTVVAIAVHSGAATAFDALARAVLTDYMSFIVLLFALYVVAGGIVVTGNLRGTPLSNTGMLFAGLLLASVVGTTGAAMIVIRPLIRANERRRHNAHVPVFAIFLVANIGGALTPIGNPPLFVGFLHGVDFFWSVQHLVPATCLIAGLVLAIFIAVDAWCWRDEHPDVVSLHRTRPTEVRIRGWLNVPLIAAMVATILLSSMWPPAIDIGFAGLQAQNVVRDVILLVIALVSLKLTPLEHRRTNGFTWEPIREVAKLFAGIFICIIPVLAMLEAGPRGSFAFLLALTSDGGTPNNLAYFWLAGILSALLDNAPTYLVFFELAGGNAGQLMGPLAGTLAAISVGASAMGALTYVGNAPNLMIQAIATERGIPMPSFFDFMAWSAVVLLPVLGLAGYLFFG
jgi:Na+/H+ antiporter NhaD/arsenite permease-like protein